MAVLIADYVYSGELRNTHRNRVFGWLEFAPDYGIFLEMAGNFSGDLAGKHIRFKRSLDIAPVKFEPGLFPDFVENLANRQIGVIERVEFRRAGMAAIPVEDFEQLPPDEQKLHVVDRDCLVLEWSSQNGRVICELVEPVWELVDEESERGGRTENNEENPGFLPDAMGDISISFASSSSNPFEDLDEDEFDDDEDDDGEDPYGLFNEELRDAVEQSLGHEREDSDAELGLYPSSDDFQPKSWDEVIPGIDPERKQLYEQWDEIVEGKKDEPISYLFPTLLKLPSPDQVQTEEEAEGLVKQILAQLALLSVAIDICEHFTMLSTYRLLASHLLPEAKVHPNLAASEMVQHYSTSDYCAECDAELFEDEDEDEDESA